MVSTKLTFTLYDIASHLIPGVAALFITQVVYNPGGREVVFENTLFIVVFGYLVGHLLHSIGSILFKGVYSNDYKGKPRLKAFIEYIDKVIEGYQRFVFLYIPGTNPDIKKALWREVKSDKKLKNVKESALDLFGIADTFVATTDFAERGILLAKEGFYRSMTVLIIYTTIMLISFKPTLDWRVIMVLGVILTDIFRHQREFFRRVKNNQIYLITIKKFNSGSKEVKK